ncbi:integrase [Yinghuangia sp. YIM S09857]|uniref:integrase n=1 Tax=Yinghuangia sp. YIM S09857 TaxID=3436929 RepID=UPI003F534968
MLVRTATATAAHHKANEDFAAYTQYAAVLLDGAGTPAGLDTGCIHGVAWFARTLGSTLLAEIDAGRNGSLAECLATTIDEVADLHADTCDLENPLTPSATVVAIRRRGPELEYLVLSDSVLVLDGPGDPLVVTDDRLDVLKRSRPPSKLDSLRLGTEEHATTLRQAVAETAKYRNQQGGFWVASVDPKAAAQALTGVVPVEGLRSVLLLSDGASRLVDTFGLASWSELVALVGDAGPAELTRRVRAAEADDPQGERWPRAKAEDDATVMMCRLDVESA